MRNEEHKIQAAAVSALKCNRKLKWLHAVPNGGARSSIIGSKMKAEGVTPGIWDLFLPIMSFGDDGRARFNGLCIEVKYGRNKLTEYQADYGIHCAENGYAIAICRSSNDIVNVVNNYMNGTHDNLDHIEECFKRKYFFEKKKGKNNSV